MLGRVQAEPAAPVRASECTQPGHDLCALRWGGGKGLRSEGITAKESDHDAQNLCCRASAGSEAGGPHLPVVRARSAALGDQLERALISVPLNVAEGAYSRGRNRQARYQSAAASAREALACLETAEALGWIEPLGPDLGGLFQQVIGTLVRLVEPRR